MPAVSAKITVQRKLVQVLSSTRANQLCHRKFALDMRLAYELKSVLKALRRVPFLGIPRVNENESQRNHTKAHKKNQRNVPIDIDGAKCPRKLRGV